MKNAGEDEVAALDIEGELFYFKSHLKADYLLNHKKMSETDFWSTDIDEEKLEEEIREAIIQGLYNPNFLKHAVSASVEIRLEYLIQQLIGLLKIGISLLSADYIDLHHRSHILAIDSTPCRETLSVWIEVLDEVDVVVHEGVLHLVAILIPRECGVGGEVAHCVLDVC